MNNIDGATAKTQIIVGSVLAVAPWWASWIETTTKIGAMVAAVAGAIVGLHGVYKIMRKAIEKRKEARAAP